MAKWQADVILDQALNYVLNNATQMAVCSTQPANYTEAVTTYKLALKTGLTSGSFTLGDGDTSGRKITTAQQAGVTVDTGGTATHVALCSGTVLLLVTTCTSQALTGGNTVTIPAYKFTLPDVV
jgi:phosphosulfolactate synthase (CoM biosynthesis protein A)